jgi:hypothetical protein
MQQCLPLCCCRIQLIRPNRIILWTHWHCFVAPFADAAMVGRWLPWLVDASFTYCSRGRSQPSTASLCSFWYKKKERVIIRIEQVITRKGRITIDLETVVDMHPLSSITNFYSAVTFSPQSSCAFISHQPSMTSLLSHPSTTFCYQVFLLFMPYPPVQISNAWRICFGA